MMNVLNVILKTVGGILAFFVVLFAFFATCVYRPKINTMGESIAAVSATVNSANTAANAAKTAALNAETTALATRTKVGETDTKVTALSNSFSALSGKIDGIAEQVGKVAEGQTALANRVKRVEETPQPAMATVASPIVVAPTASTLAPTTAVVEPEPEATPDEELFTGEDVAVAYSVGPRVLARATKETNDWFFGMLKDEKLRSRGKWGLKLTKVDPIDMLVKRGLSNRDQKVVEAVNEILVEIANKNGKRLEIIWRLAEATESRNYNLRTNAKKLYDSLTKIAKPPVPVPPSPTRVEPPKSTVSVAPGSVEPQRVEVVVKHEYPSPPPPPPQPQPAANSYEPPQCKPGWFRRSDYGPAKVGSIAHASTGAPGRADSPYWSMGR